MASNSYTPAHGRASKKYISEKRDRFTILTQKGVVATWKAAATAAGVSTNQYVIGAVERRIRDDMAGLPTDEPDEVETVEQTAQAPTADTTRGQTPTQNRVYYALEDMDADGQPRTDTDRKEEAPVDEIPAVIYPAAVGGRTYYAR